MAVTIPIKGKGTVVNHPLDKKGESVNPSTYIVQHCCCDNSEGPFGLDGRNVHWTVLNLRIGTDDPDRISEIKTGKIRAFIKIRTPGKKKK